MCRSLARSSKQEAAAPTPSGYVVGSGESRLCHEVGHLRVAIEDRNALATNVVIEGATCGTELNDRRTGWRRNGRARRCERRRWSRSRGLCGVGCARGDRRRSWSCSRGTCGYRSGSWGCRRGVRGNRCRNGSSRRSARRNCRGSRDCRRYSWSRSRSRSGCAGWCGCIRRSRG